MLAYFSKLRLILLLLYYIIFSLNITTLQYIYCSRSHIPTFVCVLISAITCRNDEFTCDDGSCVSSLLVCDGNNDCADSSDEADCGKYGHPNSRILLYLSFFCT